jgi:hypothetical protein
MLQIRFSNYCHLGTEWVHNHSTWYVNKHMLKKSTGFARDPSLLPPAPHPPRDGPRAPRRAPGFVHPPAGCQKHI